MGEPARHDRRRVASSLRRPQREGGDVKYALLIYDTNEALENLSEDELEAIFGE